MGEMWERGVVTYDCLALHRIANLVSYWIYKKKEEKINLSVTQLNFFFSMFQVDPSDKKYSQVQYIVLDPSCSGSGIASRMDNLIDDAEDECKKEVYVSQLPMDLFCVGKPTVM